MPTLVISTEDLAIHVDPSSDSGTGDITSIVIPLAGALSIHDVTHPSRYPRLRIHDLDAASWWLPALLGPQVATRILSYGAEVLRDPGDLIADQVNSDRVYADDPDAITVDIDAPPTESLLDLQRLAVGLWLHRWWPEPEPNGEVCALHRWLLDAETALLADALEGVLPEESDIAPRLLQRSLSAFVLELARYQHHVGDGTLDHQIADTVRAASILALDHVESHSPDLGILADLVGGVRTSEAAIQELIAQREPGTFARFVSQSDPFSSQIEEEAAHVPGGPFPFTAPIDPRVVDGGVFSRAADAISWQVIEQNGGLLCQVRVRLADYSFPGGFEVQRLPASMYIVRLDYGGSTSVAPLVFPSEADSTTGFLIADSWLESSPHEDLSVSVQHYRGGVELAENRAVQDRVADQEQIRRIISTRVLASRQPSAETAPSPAAPFLGELLALHPGSTRWNRVEQSIEKMVAEELSDLDLEWLLLTEASLALRGHGELNALSATDERHGLRIDLRRAAGGWRLRVISVGGSGEFTLTVRFDDDAEERVTVRVAREGSTTSRLEALTGRIPVAIRVITGGQ